MTTTFKVGDKVRCVDTTGYGGGKLTKDQTYTVQGVRIDGLVTLEGKYGGFRSDRFELVKGEPAKVTFKVGDKVRRKNTYGSVKKEVTVSKIITTNYGVTQVWGDDQLWTSPDGLELIEAVKTTVSTDLGGAFTTPYRTREIVKRWIIAVLDVKGLPRPSEKPAIYASQAQAEKVAQEMAKKHPGETFMVFQGTAVAAIPATVTPELVRL